MKYMTLYVEIIPAAASISDEEIRSATASTLSGVHLKTRDGCVIGHVVHAQVTEGPKPVHPSGGAR